MLSVPRASGIYQIRCIPTGKIYIGSAVNIRERWRKHRESLLRNGHDNSYLQRAWNKYGADAFEWSVLELVLEPFLLFREQHYLDKLKPYDHSRGFNFSPTAGSTYGLKMNAEQREAIASGLRGRKHTEETKAKIRAAHVGKARPASVIERVRLARCTRRYVVTSPDGVEYRIANLTAFCKSNGLNQAAMVRVVQGKVRQHKGWLAQYDD